MGQFLFCPVHLFQLYFFHYIKNGKSENVEIVSEKDDIYITFWNNKTGEIAPYFVASDDRGQTFIDPCS